MLRLKSKLNQNMANAQAKNYFCESFFQSEMKSEEKRWRGILT